MQKVEKEKIKEKFFKVLKMSVDYIRRFNILLTRVPGRKRKERRKY